ncbi:dynamin family protein [Helicobacter sp. 11S02629-2]|uniref:dynamin family protein n=1 Tax=Helicobacter sp. 11S02629-2 TaxID=1476195 RepID=UPI000BA7E08E|nr:dynamin family protein [Helicobacter sp. 11S02629-2]PAF44909.1 hypothetical protein BKH40_04270 [Helicobacter sp. 11S02629-2]
MEELKYDKDKLELIKDLEEAKSFLQKSSKALIDSQERLGFVAKILSAQTVIDNNLASFEEVIEKDYADFANTVSFKDEVAQYTKLKNLQKELYRILSLKDLANKSTIAVGGGFSAGKSKFITSFFEDESIKLPIGVKPVTAIASYIVHGEINSIKGYTYKGGTIDIPLELYASLSHDFIKELGFNIKEILPMMTMTTKMTKHKHICFIDTPGYNPSSTGTTSQDLATASEFLQNASALMWLVGIDSSGTIPSSDLDFLTTLDLDKKELYVVISKADLKPQSELEEILSEFESVLSSYNIEYKGISAYSANTKKEIAYRKLDMESFLTSVSKDVISGDSLAESLNSVLLAYKKSLVKEKRKHDKVSQVLHSLELDVMQTGSELSPKVEDSLEDLKAKEKDEIVAIDSKLQELDNLHDKMFERLKNVLDGLDIKFNMPSFLLPKKDKKKKKDKNLGSTIVKKDAAEVWDELLKMQHPNLTVAGGKDWYNIKFLDKGVCLALEFSSEYPIFNLKKLIKNTIRDYSFEHIYLFNDKDFNGIRVSVLKDAVCTEDIVFFSSLEYENLVELDSMLADACDKPKGCGLQGLEDALLKLPEKDGGGMKLLTYLGDWGVDKTKNRQDSILTLLTHLGDWGVDKT